MFLDQKQDDFEKHEHEGNMYMDTPGLSDRKLMEKAAAAMTEALRFSGTYKLFFMVRLENGRVVADDLSTIETMMSCSDKTEIPFSIIINNVKKWQFTEIMKKEDAFKKVVTTVNAGQYTSSVIEFQGCSTHNRVRQLRLESFVQEIGRLSELDED